MKLVIRRPNKNEYESWYGLWQQYLKFYESSDLPENITQLLWQRIHDSQNPIECFVAENTTTQQLVGLVHYFPHVNTWYENNICYLEDLVVDSSARGLGAGEALINKVVSECELREWPTLYWHTQSHNEVARGLYDKLTGGNDGFVKYTIEINKDN